MDSVQANADSNKWTRYKARTWTWYGRMVGLTDGHAIPQMHVSHMGLRSEQVIGKSSKPPAEPDIKLTSLTALPARRVPDSFFSAHSV